MCHESVHSLQNKCMAFCISSQHLWQKLQQDHSQRIAQAQLLDLGLQSSLQGYVLPQILCMETHSCITSHQNCIMFGVEDYSDVFILCTRWLYLCDFFITAKMWFFYYNCQNKVWPLFTVASYEWLWERTRWQQSSSVKFHRHVCILWIQNCEVQTLYFIFVYLLR